MISATLRFYEELNDFVKKEYRKQDIPCRWSGKRSVKDLIESHGVPHVEVDLILVNGRSVGFDHLVEDGDRISVYPVFELLDIEGVTHLRKTPIRDPRFIVDINLGKLAKYLRMLGFDVLYGKVIDDDQLASLSSVSGRILLTLDRGLLMRKNVTRGILIRSRIPRNQCVEVVERLDLWNMMAPLSRCMRCNNKLEAITADSPFFDEIMMLVPPRVKERCKDFSFCSRCNKVYWEGDHMKSMMRFIEEIRKRQV